MSLRPVLRGLAANLSTGSRGAMTTVLLLAYLAVIGFTSLHHEPWRDEAQAWLIARDLPLPGVLAQMSWEGSPALWHVLLFPFAQAGAPYASEAVIHAVLALAAMGLFLRRAPFPLWLRALVVFSYYFSYEYAVVARNYGLSALILFGLAALHPQRRRRPLSYAALVALLANTNVHSWALAAGLVVMLALEARRNGVLRGRSLAVTMLAAAGLLVAVLQVGLPPRNAFVGAGVRLEPTAAIAAVRDAWLPGFPGPAVVAAAGFMALVALVLWRLARTAFWLLCCGVGGLFAIFTFKHAGGLRHHGLIVVFTIFALWLAWDRLAATAARTWRRAIAWSLGALMLASVPFTFRAHFDDRQGLFSGASAMAAYIGGQHLAERVIVACPSAPTSAVLPYLPRVRFWYADVSAPGTFVTWNRAYDENRKVDPVEAARRAAGAPGWGPGALLLLNAPLPAPADFGLHLRLAVVDGVYTGFGEQMYLYEKVD